ncbi:2855_t:CDS:2 [Dentiscutata erythropus]|uniref:2855_t:CDS:1 n=1 Tax=Dentiscutata erythropus TaxID=1348616 RepID=A0A9N9HCH3_9GLOM|nr:2855_t:CDS:2 [Dentiscutata erythropus]
MWISLDSSIDVCTQYRFRKFKYGQHTADSEGVLIEVLNRIKTLFQEMCSSELLYSQDSYQPSIQYYDIHEENSQNLEDFDPNADLWDALNYYKSSQIVNNESSFPEDQSEYWEKNEHLESLESSEAVLDNNFLAISISSKQTPQKHKLKSALEFILNALSLSSSETNQKRSRFDDENDE